MSTTETSPAITDCLIDRTDLHAVRFRTQLLAPSPLDAGTVLMRVDRFALTSNNVTYAAFGDAMSYWGFFPTHEEGWGCIPTWGFGTVVDANGTDVEDGDRYYGYFPMASHVVVRPGRIRETGFIDDIAHRQSLPRLYNQYTRCATDPLYDAAHEELQMLFRPLFITSFVLDDFLADGDFFGTRAVLISSASSKTAYGLAWQLSQRRAAGGPEVIALTSSRNAEFVTSLGCYDRVITYEALEVLDPAMPVAYVDFAGDRAFRRRLHKHFTESMRLSLAVGSSHVEAMGATDEDRDLPGAKPTFFFAPAQIRKRSEEWGAAVFQSRFAEAWRRFAHRVSDRSRPWIRVVERKGKAAVESTYRTLLENKAAPDTGYVLSLSA